MNDSQKADREHLERRLEASLKELEELRYALDVSAIVAITDRRGDITFANDNFCKISGYARGELLGQNHRIINSGFHPKSFFRSLWKTIASGKVWTGEIKNRAKNGTSYWVHTTIVPLLGADGKPEQYVSIRHDITERKRLEAELVRAAQVSLVGEMAAGLAHEIKNPLAGIQGAVDILIRRRDAGDPERTALENVKLEVQRIDATVRALLDHARPRKLERAPASLVETVRRAVILASDHANAERRDVRFDFDTDEDECLAEIDAAQIEDAVLNLLLNAYQAIELKGRVQVRLTRERDPREMAVVEVNDDGRGIDAENLQRIFSPFYTTRPGGTGLGLAAVRRIARAHGGDVAVASTPGRGTSFTLRIPIAPTAVGSRADRP